jgi:cytochrome c oxidase subunit 4
MDAHAHHADLGHEHVTPLSVYLGIFGALMVLTIITVGVSYVHLPVAAAVTVALIVATIKGSLVAMYFMHLLHERRIIYWVLLLTLVFFIFMMFVPLFTNGDRIPGTTYGISW